MLMDKYDDDDMIFKILLHLIRQDPVAGYMMEKHFND